MHYDGYSEDWDETIPATRIRGRLSASPTQAGATPPAKLRTRPGRQRQRQRLRRAAAAQRLPDRRSRPGRMARSIYPATIINVLGDDRYRVHYENYGNRVGRRHRSQPNSAQGGQ